jgi:hypothetical protein
MNKIPFFFIIGRPRSGTSLLRMLLDAHPQVSIPFECPMILDLWPKYGQLKTWSTNTKNEFCEDVVQVRKFAMWQLSAKHVREILEPLPENMDFNALISHLYQHFPSVFPKDKTHILGDKNPIYSLYLPQLFQLFPEARFIYLNRDFRDHALSMQKHQMGSASLFNIGFKWAYAYRCFKELQQQAADRFLYIRYEDFVESPEEHYQQLCRFLQIDYEPEALSFYQYKNEFEKRFSEDLINKHHSNLFRPINASSVYKWKEVMSAKDRDKLNFAVGSLALEAGYEWHQPKGNSLWTFQRMKERKQVEKNIQKRSKNLPT